ncbi:hypothetical protein PLICRDRAFT_179379 [Plicaturopsis crispa FD-325 SS-3]|uniref:BTB domain-containing protein n=1 Tax=Plicaturopsis crispa FD-325 SS-3 TaxID=944288 RepID=A0A0C9T5D3_PLICR|nr:hypothetical protein PLICRDRAFT_179379 [Plicaturopsis crispa FD-325 SS-3]
MADTVPPQTDAPPPTRHAEFYFDVEGTDVFLVQNTLFRVHRPLLVMKSTVFENMFALPTATHKDGDDSLIDDVEGRTDAKPIHLPQVMERDFSFLLAGFIYARWLQPPQAVEDYIGALKLATMWEMHDARQAVIWQLEQYHSQAFKPIRKLEVARLYSVPSLAAPAFRIMARRRISDLSLEDISSIGIPTFIILSQISEEMQSERKLVARMAPPMCDPHTSCDDHARCAKEWEEAWWNQIAPIILHPNPMYELSFAWGAEQVVSILRLPRMTPGCKEAMLQMIRDGQGFKGEQNFIEKGVERMNKLLYSP